MGKHDDHGNALGFERLVFFSDAVMAIAITLMALEIRIPELDPENAAAEIGPALSALVPHIFVYVLSFVVIGMYWIVHHRLFRQIHRYNIRLMWFNLIFLMSIAFLPVATNALGNYNDLALPTAFYAGSVAFVGLSEFALWWYATSKNYTVAISTKYGNVYFAARILAAPAVFLFSLLLIPFGAHYMQLSWLLIIPLLFTLSVVFRKEHAERDIYSSGEVE